MKITLSRRELLKAGLIGGTGAVLLGPGVLARSWAAEAEKRLCVTLCNHWSYIGIGWNLGIESIALSATDAMETADREPHVKTCMNFDARAVELLAEKFPEVAQRMKRYLSAGKVELIGGTYGQPLGTTVGGESNIRQVVVGRETIRKTLGYEVATFLEEEEFSHPQVPQIAAGADYRYTSLAQVDTWGRAGIPVLEYNSVGFTQPLLCRIGEPHEGDLPPARSFLRVTPETAMLSAFRKKASRGFELRVVETEGQAADAGVEMALPIAGAIETNLLGRKIGDVPRRETKLSFPIDPWKIRTFEIT